MAIVETTRSITGGVDTHLDTHVVAALDPNGGVLGVAALPATRSGYSSLNCRSRAPAFWCCCLACGDHLVQAICMRDRRRRGT